MEMKCNHNWRYVDGKTGSAPYSDDDDRHVIDMYCTKCEKIGVEVYTFEGFEEEDEESK